MRSLLLLAALGCHREAPTEVRADPTPHPTTAPVPSTPPSPKPVHHLQGDIEGRFSLVTEKTVVGEPIVVAFEMTPTRGPLTVFVGGDMRNRANYPLRFSVRATRVTDATESEVCDLVANAPFPSFGGPGSERTLAKSETMHEKFVINPACPALATAGRYRITLHRRVTTLSMTITKPGTTVPTSCDVVPINEDPLPSWIDPACAKQLRDAPSATSVLELQIAPYDAKAVRSAVDARLKEINASTPRDEILRHRIERHLCGFLSCTCPKPPVPDTDLIGTAPATLPAGYPAGCP